MSKALTIKEFIVSPAQSNARIDMFLSSVLPDVSRRKIRQILDVGGCYVNNKRMHIASRQVKSGDKVRVEFNLEALSKTRQKAFILRDEDILHDEKNLIAINKPPGLPSQATRDQDVMHAEVCLRRWLKSSDRAKGSVILLHRLDKETSGILLFATSNEVSAWVTDQFRDKRIKKTYWAICFGLPTEPNFKVECYLSAIDKKTGKVSPVRSGGKQSRTEFVTRYKCEELNISLIECYPETGRSHQIRVHLSMAGFPILGDKKYGDGSGRGLRKDVLEIATFHHMLHARAIEVPMDTEQMPVKITAEPPPEFLRLLVLMGVNS
jgi:23S rRNA pseudouridine1911/1915/1917 synthase